MAEEPSLLHIHAQYVEHDYASIVGNRRGLEHLPVERGILAKSRSTIHGGLGNGDEG